MTTVQLFHRIGRRARGGDFTKLSMSEQTDLAEAANSAMQECYGKLPERFKEITEGFVLPAPRAITLSVTQFSAQLSSDVFDPSEIGRTVVLDGDAAWNQVIATNRMLNPYMGATGTVAGNVYGDAVFSTRYPFNCVIGNPRFADQSMAPLISSTLARGNADPGIWLQQTIGRPMIWWTQNMGNSEGSNPMLVIRVSPAPASAYAINVRLSFWPQRLTLADYAAATTIYVPDQLLDKSLIPLALRALMSTRIFETMGPADEKRLEQRALEAEEFLKSQIPQMAPNNKIYCPLGF